MTNNQYKKLFPIFEKNPDLHYLDSAATGLKPRVMVDKILEYYTQYSANIHRGLYFISEKATVEYEQARKKVADFLGARSEDEVVFTSGTTDSTNLISYGWGENNLRQGDEVLVLESEHHSNLITWQQLAKKLNLSLKFVSFDNIVSSTTSKTKLLAMAHVSNVLGEVNPIGEIVESVRRVAPEICVVVDGAQAVAHVPVDVTDLDIDFYVFSGHKLYGPTGVGVVYGKALRWGQMDPIKFGGGMMKEVTTEKSTWATGPEKFEAGTPAIAEVIGLGAAVDFVNSIGFEEIQNHERELTAYLLDKLKVFDWLGVVGDAGDKSKLGVVAMYPKVEGLGTSHDIADILGRDFNVCVRAGFHCAMPLHQKLSLSTGTVRASLGLYNDKEDIDKLIEGLKSAKEIFNHLTI